jgi:RNA polymerase sigma-70 factor, ECF subfamily
VENLSTLLAALYQQCAGPQGLKAACEQFFKLFRPTLERVALRVAQQFGAGHETEDVIQEISLKLVEKDSSILAGLPQEPSSASAYLSVVAANAARDFFRSRQAEKRGIKRTISFDDTLESLSPRTQNDADRHLIMTQIEGFLPRDRKSRSVFWLYYRQGFSAREIAAIPAFELTVKGVESLIRRITLSVRRQVVQGENTVPGESGRTRVNPS